MFARPETTKVACGCGKDSGIYEDRARVVDEAPERGLQAVGRYVSGGGPPPHAVKSYEADYAYQKKQLVRICGEDGAEECDKALSQGWDRSRRLCLTGWC